MESSVMTDYEGKTIRWTILKQSLPDGSKSGSMDLLKEREKLETKKTLKRTSTMEMMSEQIAELATALSKAQGEFRVAVHDKKNPHFKNSYASLESIHDAIKEPLAKHGLSVTHLPWAGKMYTTLMHSSGQFIRCEFDLPEGTAQQKGSALSYFKRYGLCCLLAIPTGEDEDDGNKAEEVGAIVPKPSYISFMQVKELEEALEHDESRISNLLRFHNIDSLTKFPLKEFGSLMAKYKKVAK